MFAIIRSQKIHTTQGINGLESHLKRQYIEPNVDPERSDRNTHQLHNENSSSIVESLKICLNNLKIIPRKNAVLAVEYVVTASPEFFKQVEEDHRNSPFAKDTYTNRERYFRDALDYLSDRHGRSNILSSTIHLDEETPHMHVVVVPIDGKNKLNARHFLGGRDKMRKLQDDFYESITDEGKGIFKELERGKRKEKGEIEKYTQRTSPEIARVRRSLAETMTGIKNEEKSLLERLNYLRQAKAHLDQVAAIEVKADLHKPEQRRPKVKRKRGPRL